MSGKPARLGVGMRLTVAVETLDGSAAALARTDDGRKVRVPGGVPGDVLKVEVVARGRKEVWAKTIAILTPSPRRVEAPCPIVDRCGTCPWQHVAYGDQLAAKGRVLREALGRHDALATAAVHDPIGIGKPVGYRTKVQMPAGGHKHSILLGFYAPRSHAFIAARECVVQHPSAEAVRAEIINVLNRHEILPYEENTQTGDLRHVLIRVAEGTGQVGAVLVVRSYDAVDWAMLATELQTIDGLTGVWANENPGTGNAVLGPRTVHLGGARRLHDVVGGVGLQRDPVSFFQTNHRAAEHLARLVRQLLPERIGTLVDLYAGGGLFAALLAGRCDAIHLVESNATAVAAARATLNELGATQAVIHLGRAAEQLQRLVSDGVAADAMVVDPPRAGVSEDALQAIVALAPQHLVYVSCHPKSLVRDLRALAAAGFELVEVHSIDMFPHTPHVEAVCLLRSAHPGKNHAA